MPTRANTGKVRPRTALFASPWCSARAVRRGAARLFVAMAATALIAGCGGDDNENTEVGGNTTHARLTANLTGSIQDTNGTPIEGATVGVAGRTTSTNALGQWLLTNVPVVNVQNNSDTPCAGTGGESNAGTLGGCVGVPLLVTVTAEGHLGGHGYVLPEGQIFSSENAAEAVAAGNGGDGGDGAPFLGTTTGGGFPFPFRTVTAEGGANLLDGGNGGNAGDGGNGAAGDLGGQTNPQLVWSDGNTVQAETIALPALGASIKVEINQVTGQPFAGGDIALEFDQARIDRSDETAAGINFDGVLYSGTTDADGVFTFTGLPADSVFGLRATGFSFNDCDADEPPDVTPVDDDVCTADRAVGAGGAAAACAARTVGAGATAQQVTTNEGESCLIGSDDVATRVDYVGFGVKPISAGNDLVSPYLTSVAGVFNLVGCSDCETSHGLLLEGVNQSFSFQYSEDLEPITPADVLVFNQTTGSYVALAPAPDGVVQSGDTVTITLADPLPPQTFFRVYLLIPAHRDLANNTLGDEPDVTNTPDPVLFDLLADGSCSSDGCLTTPHVTVNLCTFFRPATNPGAVTDLAQEEFDPAQTDGANDWPINQTRSVAFNDVRDGDDGAFNDGDATSPPFDEGPIQQLNAPGQSDAPFALGALASGFGEYGPGPNSALVDTDVARVEWTPIDGVTSYRITVDRAAANIGTLTTSNFTLGGYAPTAVGSLINVETGAIDRAGVTRNFFIYENAEAGDVVTVAAIDGLGNPGAPASVTIADNVEPTATLQTSYNDLHDYTHGGENGSADQDGCVVNPILAGGVSPDGTNDSAIHAGVVISGSAAGGSGGETSTGGTATSADEVCIGIAPELLIALSDTDTDIDTAHNELVAGRDAGLSADLPASFINDYAAEIYDDAAWLAWPVAARTVGGGADSQGGMGIAVTEDLASVGTPATTADDAALSNWAFQNSTVNQPTVNGNTRTIAPQNLLRVTVSDALALANDDSGETIDLTGAITDLAGNPASAAAAAVLQIRDEWAPYMTSAFRTTEGDLVFTWNEAVEIDNQDHLYFADQTGLTVATGTFVPGNFSQSPDGKTVTVAQADISGFAPTLATALTVTTLTYDDQNEDGVAVLGAKHLIVDWREIADLNGNSWQIYENSFADTGVFADDVPGFALVDSIGPFSVTILQPGFNNGLAQFTLTYAFTHPVFLDTNDVCGTANTIAPVIPIPAGGELGFLGTNGTLEVAGGAPDPDFVSTGFTIEPLDIVSTTATDTTISFQIDLSLDATAETLASGDSIATANVAVSQLICGTMGDTVGPATQVVP